MIVRHASGHSECFDNTGRTGEHQRSELNLKIYEKLSKIVPKHREKLLKKSGQKEISVDYRINLILSLLHRLIEAAVKSKKRPYKILTD